jgi:hypothetical protein
MQLRCYQLMLLMTYLINSETNLKNLKAFVQHWMRVMTSDTAQLLIVIRRGREHFGAVAVLTSVRSLQGTTTGKVCI